MDIALIGSGNTATVLGRMLKNAGHVITGVYSKTYNNAALLADELNAQYVGDITSITTQAALYIIAVTDDMVQKIAAEVTLPGKMVVHTSGSVSKNVLSAISPNYGVLYPLQSLRKEASHQPLVPLLVDGSSTAVTVHIRLVAQSISPMVEQAGDDKRLKLHLAAVMVSNFTNHLYSLTEDFCAKEKVSFSTLVPLIQEVAERAVSYSPALMQTGPAVRGDKTTIAKHLQLLAGYPLQKKAYTALTESITEFYNKP